jgi:hypothetical protein
VPVTWVNLRNKRFTGHVDHPVHPPGESPDVSCFRAEWTTFAVRQEARRTSRQPSNDTKGKLEFSWGVQTKIRNWRVWQCRGAVRDCEITFEQAGEFRCHVREILATDRRSKKFPAIQRRQIYRRSFPLMSKGTRPLPCHAYGVMIGECNDPPYWRVYDSGMLGCCCITCPGSRRAGSSWRFLADSGIDIFFHVRAVGGKFISPKSETSGQDSPWAVERPWDGLRIDRMCRSHNSSMSGAPDLDEQACKWSVCMASIYRRNKFRRPCDTILAT